MSVNSNWSPDSDATYLQVLETAARVSKRAIRAVLVLMKIKSIRLLRLTILYSKQSTSHI